MSYIYSERKEEIRQVHNADKTISEECINNIIIGRITEAPEHHRDNEFIHSGYRINFNSSKHVLKSLFMIHNESVNIWSHLLGAGLIIILVAYTSIYYQSHKAEIYDILEHKWDGLNDRWKEFSIYLVDKMPSYENFRSDLQIKLKEGQSTFNDYASSFKNKTVHYFNAVDDTLNEYKDYIKAKFQ